jgi:hypothetical protein
MTQTRTLFVSVRFCDVIFRETHTVICVALDPNIKLAYAEEKWDPEYFERRRKSLEKVARTYPLLRFRYQPNCYGVV